ncbi:hypothetical protein EVAR_9555_1 [Eumeta japonica]|uniref:Uncharacterized protein n=1 Tax=Eumeta variegata TaxID=151549 RepID=A0A4C1U3M2_EUMVA|nr:hypothetical protein EVAR_9555_1 [Eumeta japonica]
MAGVSPGPVGARGSKNLSLEEMKKLFFHSLAEQGYLIPEEAEQFQNSAGQYVLVSETHQSWSTSRLHALSTTVLTYINDIPRPRQTSYSRCLQTTLHFISDLTV